MWKCELILDAMSSLPFVVPTPVREDNLNF